MQRPMENYWWAPVIIFPFDPLKIVPNMMLLQSLILQLILFKTKTLIYTRKKVMQI